MSLACHDKKRARNKIFHPNRCISYWEDELYHRNIIQNIANSQSWARNKLQKIKDGCDSNAE